MACILKVWQHRAYAHSLALALPVDCNPLAGMGGYFGDGVGAH